MSLPPSCEQRCLKGCFESGRHSCGTGNRALKLHGVDIGDMADKSDQPSAGRIAIKLGSSVSSKSTRLPSRPGVRSTLGKRLRPVGEAGDPESDEDRDGHGKHVAISSLGDEPVTRRLGSHSSIGKQASADKPVIEPLQNEFGQSRRYDPRRRQRPPPETNGSSVRKEVEVADAVKDVKWGLAVAKKPNGQYARDEGPASKEDYHTDGHGDDRTSVPNGADKGAEDVDQQALRALTGEEAGPKKSKMVIRNGVDEDDYQSGRGRLRLHGADISTDADYDNVGPDDFGAALLRGMGWNGKHEGEKQEVKRRPNLMGLGAKELPGVEEFGSWNQKNGKPRPPRVNEYNREKDRHREHGRERDSIRNVDRHRHYDRERDRDRDRERDKDRDRHRDRR
jgi:hypothetical protein